MGNVMLECCERAMHVQCVAELLANRGNICPQCGIPCLSDDGVSFVRQACHEHGISLDQLIPEQYDTTSRAHRESIPPPPISSCVFLCCEQVACVSEPRAGPEHAEFVGTGERFMHWSPEYDHRHRDWNPAWQCMSCARRVEMSDTCFDDLPFAPICSDHGPRSLMFDCQDTSRAWICCAPTQISSQPVDIFDCEPEYLPDLPTSWSDRDREPTVHEDLPIPMPDREADEQTSESFAPDQQPATAPSPLDHGPPPGMNEPVPEIEVDVTRFRRFRPPAGEVRSARNSWFYCPLILDAAGLLNEADRRAWETNEISQAWWHLVRAHLAESTQQSTNNFIENVGISCPAVSLSRLAHRIR